MCKSQWQARDRELRERMRRIHDGVSKEDLGVVRCAMWSHREWPVLTTGQLWEFSCLHIRSARRCARQGDTFNRDGNLSAHRDFAKKARALAPYLP